MAGSNFVLHVTGNPNIPTLRLINVRALPGTGTAVAVLLQTEVGTRDLPILDVQIDADSRDLNGRVYQWFQVRFPNGTLGWLRDDLCSVQGDGTSFGYPNLSSETYAFTLTRAAVPAPSPQPAPPTPAPQPVPTVLTPPGGEPVTPPTVLQPAQPAVVDVDTPAPAPSPQPTPPTPAPAAPTTPAVPAGQVIGVVLGNGGLNLRRAAIIGAVLRRLNFLEQVGIVKTEPQPGTNYIWAEVETNDGTRGWVRTDFLSIRGDGSRFGLSTGDEYPAPLDRYWWVRGQNDGDNPNEAPHLGWDFGSDHGEAVKGGPNGGKVAQLLNCTRCTPDRPNVLKHGLPLNAPSVFSDPAWGFGYGNAVIMRYLNEDLPASTRQRLSARGLSGAHLYVIYAHLSGINVAAGDEVAGGAKIGSAGNTGNSTAVHLHLEVRASTNANETSWFNMRANVLDPSVLFIR